MNIINQIKTPDDLYQSGITEKEDGTFECPVCNKVYKQKKSAENHYEKQTCYRTRDLFENTPYEESAFGLYESIISEQNPKARTNMTAFRKSKMYSLVVNYCVFCYLNEVDDFGLYYSYLKTIRGMKMPNMVLSKALNEEYLREYRVFLHQHPSYVDSKTFWERHYDELLSDEDFFVRSLEKSHITLTSVKKRKVAMQWIDELPIGYQHRIVQLMGAVGV